MRESMLEKICCPKILQKRPCQGPLRISKGRYFKNRKYEIMEGYLECQSCGQVYPVLAGIPLLLDGLGAFIRRNYYFIKGISKELGFFDKEMDKFFFRQMAESYNNVKEQLRLPQQRFDKAAVEAKDRRISSYFINHYDNIGQIVDPRDPFCDFISKFYHPTPFEVLQGFILRQTGGRIVNTSLDIGSSVGGLSAWLAGRSKNVIGIDLSFYSLIKASSIIKHLPGKATDYRLLNEPNVFQRRKIKAPVRKNVDFLLASGTNLPFKDKQMDIVLSCNVIDIIDKPRKLLKEKMRVTKKNGLCLSSDPYQFFWGLTDNPKSADKAKPKNKISEILKTKMRILEERDNSVWLLRHYLRSYSVYFNYSFCAKKLE